jgi:hypothetical protein
MKRILVAVGFYFCLYGISITGSTAQVIDGKVVDEEGIPLPFANINLIKAADDSTFFAGTGNKKLKKVQVKSGSVGLMNRVWFYE